MAKKAKRGGNQGTRVFVREGGFERFHGTPAALERSQNAVAGAEATNEKGGSSDCADVVQTAAHPAMNSSSR